MWFDNKNVVVTIIIIISGTGAGGDAGKLGPTSSFVRPARREGQPVETLALASFSQAAALYQ